MFGCLRFFLSILAFWGFSALGWITISTSMPLWAMVLLVSVLVFVVDFALLLVNMLVTVLSLPASCLSLGLFQVVVNGIFKYFSLYVVAVLTGWYVMPWIFGPFWLQAIIIGTAFTVISYVGGSSSSSSSSS